MEIEHNNNTLTKMNRLKILLSGLLMISTSTVFGQGAKNIRINEVLTNNTASIQDEFGQREAWYVFYHRPQRT